MLKLEELSSQGLIQTSESPTRSVCLEQGARDAGGWPDQQGYTVRAAARCPSVPEERAGSGSDL